MCLKNSTPSGKLRAKITSLVAKSTSPGLSKTRLSLPADLAHDSHTQVTKFAAILVPQFFSPCYIWQPMQPYLKAMWDCIYLHVGSQIVKNLHPIMDVHQL